MSRRGRRLVHHFATAVAVLSVAGCLAAAALEVPYLAGRVNDLAGMVPADARERLELLLSELETETGAQIAVLTIPALEGEALEEYSLRVAETWALGREEFDDGALLLIARDDRKMRIEVGYGLEPTLTDAISRRILDNVIRPRFRQGDFGGGIEAGVEAIAAIVRGEGELPPPEAGDEAMPLAGRLLGSLFFFSIVGLFSLAAIGTRGCAGWFLWLFLMPFWLLFPSVLIHPRAGVALLAAWLILFPILWIAIHQTKRGKKWAKSSPWFDTSGRRGGWSSGGWSSGGGFSSGGFSGGGGSFGGGGASSSW